MLCLQGRKLLVIGTTSRKDVLRDFEMLNVFSQIVHVSNISNSKGLLAVLENAEIFSKEELDHIRKRTYDKKWVWGCLLGNCNWLQKHKFQQRNTLILSS